jgi:sugar lactone lactonase YvrE
MRKIAVWVLWLLGASFGSWAAAAESCPTSRSMQIICGPEAVEDLVRIGDSQWLLGSGMAEANDTGHLRLVDTRAHRVENIYPDNRASPAKNPQRFPDCKDEPDAKKFSAHGIALRDVAPGRHELLVVNHGREAIEFFQVTVRGGARPSVHWIGCVPLPADTYMNSVAPMPDGGFVTSLFYAPSRGGIDAVFTKQVTGGLLRWSPGGKVTPIPGTEVSGANGIVVSQGGRVIHMTAWGTRELLRFEWRNGQMTRRVVPLSFAGDNLRWSQDGKTLLVGGQKFVPKVGGPDHLDGWSVVRVNPDTMAVSMVRDAGPDEAMQGITVAVEVGDDIWVGQFRGNQVGYFPRK